MGVMQPMNRASYLGNITMIRCDLRRNLGLTFVQRGALGPIVYKALQCNPSTAVHLNKCGFIPTFSLNLLASLSRFSTLSLPRQQQLDLRMPDLLKVWGKSMWQNLTIQGGLLLASHMCRVVASPA